MEAASLGALFLQSMWIGLSISAPVGPIGVMVIQRTMRHGVRVGLATGLGAAVADGLYGAVGAFGVQSLIGALQSARRPLALVGGAFLLWLAWRTWRAADADHEAGVEAVAPAGASAADDAARAGAAPAVGMAPSLGAAFAGTLVLTLANPSTVLSFIAIFGAMVGGGAGAGLDAVAGSGCEQAAPDGRCAALPTPTSPRMPTPAAMAAGVFAGSSLWWLGLCAAVSALRSRFDARARRTTSRASALMMAAFALWQWRQLVA